MATILLDSILLVQPQYADTVKNAKPDIVMRWDGNRWMMALR
ncbi:MAG: hypothetical protein U0176_03720 [Bacteroidia bacterium]